jgi:hypothetical protein
VAVRASNTGSYAAIRNDVELWDVEIEESTLEEDLIMSIPLGDVVEDLEGEKMEVETSDEEDEFETVTRTNGVDRPWEDVFADLAPPPDSCDAVFVVRDGHRLYLHKGMLVCRSATFREFLSVPNSKDFHVEDIDGVLELHFEDIGVVAATQFVYFLYTDKAMDLSISNDNERQQVSRDLRNLATKFGLNQISLVFTSGGYHSLPQEQTLRTHLAHLRNLPTLTPPDTILCLSDKEVPCHAFILQARCPFFGAMLDTVGMGGGWVASRRKEADAQGTEIKIQLKHLSWSVMALVLENIYTDAGVELFDSVRKETVDEFLEFVIEVMAVSNELLLDRLKDICQSVLSRFGTSFSCETNSSDAA